MLFIVGIIFEIEFLTNEKIITIKKNIIKLTEKKVDILTKRQQSNSNSIWDHIIVMKNLSF